jgi:hypothetical protein
MFGPVEQEFVGAAYVIKRRLRWSRSGGQPIEAAGAVASFDDGSGKFTIYVNGWMYNYIGFTIANALKVASHQLNQLRQQALSAQGVGARRTRLAREWTPGQIHRGPHRQHHRER